MNDRTLPQLLKEAITANFVGDRLVNALETGAAPSPFWLSQRGLTPEQYNAMPQAQRASLSRERVLQYQRNAQDWAPGAHGRSNQRAIDIENSLPTPQDYYERQQPAQLRERVSKAFPQVADPSPMINNLQERTLKPEIIDRLHAQLGGQPANKPALSALSRSRDQSLAFMEPPSGGRPTVFSHGPLPTLLHEHGHIASVPQVQRLRELVGQRVGTTTGAETKNPVGLQALQASRSERLSLLKEHLANRAYLQNADSFGVDPAKLRDYATAQHETYRLTHLGNFLGANPGLSKGFVPGSLESHAPLQRRIGQAAQDFQPGALLPTKVPFSLLPPGSDIPHPPGGPVLPSALKPPALHPPLAGSSLPPPLPRIVTPPPLPARLPVIKKGFSVSLPPTLAKRSAYPEEERLGEALKAVDPDPTPAQREAGNHRMGHVRMHGLDISIEVAKGQTRRKAGKDGKVWSKMMHAHYGYIKQTKSKADKDHIDVYVGDHPASEIVFVVDQLKPDGSFDEHKVMLGHTTAEDAKACYLKHMPADRCGGVTPMTMPEFKKWCFEGNTRLPVKRAAADEEFDPLEFVSTFPKLAAYEDADDGVLHETRDEHAAGPLPQQGYDAHPSRQVQPLFAPQPQAPLPTPVGLRPKGPGEPPSPPPMPPPPPVPQPSYPPAAAMPHPGPGGGHSARQPMQPPPVGQQPAHPPASPMPGPVGPH